MEEIKTKVEGIVVELLGDAAKDMRNVDSLGTDPDFQGRGYGGALVDYITGLADAEGRSTYLLSSNPINTGFYNFHGFVEIGKVFIGEGNPTWNGPPLPVLLVSVLIYPLEFLRYSPSFVDATTTGAQNVNISNCIRTSVAYLCIHLAMDGFTKVFTSASLHY